MSLDFYAVLDQVILLQRHGRVTYGALKQQFDLDEDYLDDLKAEPIYARQLAVDEQGKVLVWTASATAIPDPAFPPIHPEDHPSHQDDQGTWAPRPPVDPPPPEAERHQLPIGGLTDGHAGLVMRLHIAVI